MKWQAGQRVTVLNGDRPIALRTVDRLTPSGMPVVGGDIYFADGRGRGDLRRRRLRPSTDDDLLLPGRWKAERELRDLRERVTRELAACVGDLTEDQCHAILAILGIAP